ncbi:T9SS type A sorting domain-containing protein [Winogradskyella aurantiaca]|uniref:T9SS type A sorting domain-containing protein n=1 Tax=Winogradskyella aurantiaca TaxID=2219558 RepID=UPI000E1D74C4|nr:T9SS type A sorting domain-containing protein [Winogradskyella aurantiaca]
MKKITLLLFYLIALTGFSQDLISFETGEGYVLGDINGQDNWTVSASGPNFIANQEITDADATDGIYSLRLAQDPAFGGQVTRNTGAFYPLDAPLDASTAIISFDINITSFSSTIFEVGFDNTNENATITSIAINIDGSVNVYANTQADGNGSIVFEDTNEDLVANTWYNIRLEINGSAIEVFIDDASVYTGFVGTPNVDILRAVCVHDNQGGSFLFDNFRINNEVLSVDDVKANTYDFRYVSNTKELLLNSPSVPLENLAVYNMLGQQVFGSRLSGNSEQLSVYNLPNGIYVAQITMGGQTETFKFVKN